MTDTAVLEQFRPHTKFQRGPRTVPSEPRSKLRSAIDHHQTTLQRLSALQDARERAQESFYEACDRLREAEQLLADATRGERERLVYSYVNNEDASSSIPELEAQVDKVNQEIETIRKLRAAIDQEVELVTHNLDYRRLDLVAAAAAVVVDSAEFARLNNELVTAKSRVLTLRACLGQISHKVGAGLPSGSKALDERTSDEIDPQPSAAWENSLSNLLQDGDAELPGDV
jgi:chromosome segregation ATPase